MTFADTGLVVLDCWICLLGVQFRDFTAVCGYFIYYGRLLFMPIGICCFDVYRFAVNLFQVVCLLLGLCGDLNGLIV